jgi:hypothetical protein
MSKKGRSGFVMSSQASSAGHGEKDVKKKIVEILLPAPHRKKADPSGGNNGASPFRIPG